jgi:hypothetical protein
MIGDYRAPNRRAPTTRDRWSLLWWASDDERNPAWSWGRWFLINPFCNFLSCIIGIAHRGRYIYVARGVGWTYTDGLNWGYSVAHDGWLKRPFVSYRGSWVECCAGWKTSGGFGIALRKSGARNPGDP